MVQAGEGEVRIKELVRIQGEREYALTGFGLVVGLAGTGDSERSQATRQSLANALRHFNLNVAGNDLNARNTAAVMITSRLRSFSEAGDKLDVEVSSIGDARSLLGGTLLLTPLSGVDEKIHALAQGAVSVGGHVHESNANVVKKNHPTVGRIPHGATVERALTNIDASSRQRLVLVLHEPDYTTAQRIAEMLSDQLSLRDVRVLHPARIEVPVQSDTNLPLLISRVEALSIRPDYLARVVVNERTGTVVAGSNVRIGEVNISQGDLNVVISTRFQVSQPSLRISSGQAAAATVVPETQLRVSELSRPPVSLGEGATVGALVQAMYRVRLSTREVITVLQAIKQAGALHAELVIQ